MNHTHGLPRSMTSSWAQPVEPWPEITWREEKEARCSLLWPSPWIVSSGCPSPSPKGQRSSRESLCPPASLLSYGLVPPLVLLAWGGQNSTAAIPGFLVPVCPPLGK